MSDSILIDPEKTKETFSEVEPPKEGEDEAEKPVFIAGRDEASPPRNELHCLVANRLPRILLIMAFGLLIMILPS